MHVVDVVMLGLDDTLARKRGLRMFGTGMHHDPLSSTRSLARDYENPDERLRHVPKLILAGRLTGTLDGRPVVIEAGETGLLVSPFAFRTAWAARRTLGSVVPLLRTLKRLNVPLRMRVAGIVSVELLPNTSILAKLVAIALGRLG